MIYKKTLSKRILAGLLILMTLVMLPCVHVRAAGKQTLYIRDVRLFAMEKGTYDDARAWCESKGSDWHAAESDLNDGGESALKSKVGVFLCYQTTDNKDEAITDIAVMNEQGNYSVGAYEKLLEEQRKYFSDLVNDSKQMLKEYRDNVQAGLPLAL
ncbi:MAG: hypothetical protein J6P16_06590, partial [Eubacterium sp.]|nr:hypothetical protein [Eubacterium sp.]